MEYDFDLFVIGGGSGGVRAARVAANLDARVGIAEERYFGGTCVNVGCVPKKLFSYAAHFRDDFEDSRGFGWDVSSAHFDWSRLKNNKDIEINRLKGIYQSILESNKVAIYTERARVTGPHEVAVGNLKLSARYILIAVGGWPWIPEIPGKEHIITSNEIFTLETLPETMTVIGGGYIAVEFASIFTRLGVEVTLVYRGDLLLKGFDTEIRRFLTAELKRNMNLKLQSSPVSITRKNNKIGILLNTGDKIDCDTVLSATGRKPATVDLGLECVNIALDRHGAISVNDQFQTGEPSIYAVGDCIGRMTLTPVALAEGQIVARALFSNEIRPMTYNNIPTAVFSQPNVATVGLSEDDALANGFSIDVYSATVKQLKHTLSGRDELSLLKLVVNQMDDRVLGLHMVGPDAGELVQGFAVALNCGATKADFDRTIGIHPTLAEEFVTMRNRRKSHAAT